MAGTRGAIAAGRRAPAVEVSFGITAGSDFNWGATNSHGIKFTVDGACTLVGVMFDNNANTDVTIQVDEFGVINLRNQTYLGIPTGVQNLNLTSPVALVSGKTYMVWYTAATSHINRVAGFFSSSLHVAPLNAASGNHWYGVINNPPNSQFGNDSCGIDVRVTVP